MKKAWIYYESFDVVQWILFLYLFLQDLSNSLIIFLFCDNNNYVNINLFCWGFSRFFTLIYTITYLHCEVGEAKHFMLIVEGGAKNEVRPGRHVD